MAGYPRRRGRQRRGALMTMDRHRELQSALGIASLHRARLQAALAYLGHRLPHNGADVLALQYDDIASVELLLSRFAKLQDILGSRLFRLALELTAEPLAPNATFLDTLQRLEKIGAIPSAAGWRVLREIRNELAHDYPDDAEATAASLAEVVAAIPDLLAVDDALRAHIQRVTQ